MKLIYRVIIFLAIVLVAGSLGFVFETEIEGLVNAENSVRVIDVDESGVMVHFLDVGQGDSTIIELTDGTLIMIDAGPKSSSEELVAYLEANIFYDRDDKNIEHIILTHSDEDHCGGLPEIYENYNVINTYRPTVYTQAEVDEMTLESGEKVKVHDTQIYQSVIDLMNAEKGNIIFSKKGIVIGDDSKGKLEFLSPESDYYDSDQNNYSPFLILKYNNNEVLFTGDAGSEVELENLHLLTDIDIYKAGHHGSNTSSSVEFLEIIKPEYVIYSAGLNNSYSHPHIDVVSRLEDIGVGDSNTYKTFENGNILLNLTSQNDILFIPNIPSISAFIEMEYMLLGIIVIAFSILFLRKVKR